MTDQSPVLRVEGLTVRASTAAMGDVLPVTDVSFSLHAGEVVGLIGESGCGKTTIARALVGLLASNAGIADGSVSFRDRVVLSETVQDMDEVRGEHVGIVFQNAMSSLNPLMKVKAQLDETVKRHRPGMPRSARSERIRANLDRLGFDDVDRVLNSYPHQLSGGMRQRVAISLATVLEPEVVIADECTTALDVTTQSEVVGLLGDLARRTQAALLFVTHDLMLASEICTRILVMYSGQIVESGPAADILRNPVHPYTRALIAAVPSWGPPRDLVGIPGMPTLVRPGQRGCRFASRCPLADEACRRDDIAWRSSGSSERHGYRCIRPAVHVNY